MRAKVEQVACDFCGYGGPLSDPRWFVRTGDIDLCRWCAGAPTGTGLLSSGRHNVRIEADTWQCSCGASYAFPFTVDPAVLVALPSIVGATASRHVNRL